MLNLITIFGNKLDNTCNFLEKIKREIFDVKKERIYKRDRHFKNILK